MNQLLDHEHLERSCVVANNRMNRERVALGSNGYESEIGIDPIDYLVEIYNSHGAVRWLDLCCGRGKALIEAGKAIFNSGLSANTYIVGVDLVDMFDPVPVELDFIHLETASLHQWTTSLEFDLVTCVHGLHYLGDKLDLIERAITWLKPNGYFVGSLDLENLKSNLNLKSELPFLSQFKQNGFKYDPESHLLSFNAENQSSTHIDFGFQFCGADDQAGPNYTRQEVVDSYYR